MRFKWLRPAAPLAVLLAFVFALAACGDDDDEGGGGGDSSGATGIPEEFAAPTAAPDDAQKGGNLTLISEGDIDYMDPGAAYYQVTYTLDFGMFRQLVSWPPDEAEDPVADLAEDEPEISEDGRTITFKIKDGIRYSPPLEDREVVAADFKYAVERSLMPGVANGYTTTYMKDVTGMAEAAQAAEENTTVAPDISGIETPDDHTIVFKLDKSSVEGVLGALSLPVSSPVPEDYAKKYDAESPSTYGDHAVFTGPYMVENDGKGNLTGYSPGKEIKLVRNPSWDPETDYRPAYLDTITVQQGFSDPTSAAKKVLEGSGQVTFDFPPSPTVIQEVAQGDQYEPSQMSVTPSGGNRYVALNITEEPFDDINIRKAVIANSDRTALRNTRGGELIGPVANHFLPPLIPGFEEAGGLEAPEGLDFLESPTGDPELAAEYMKKAGFESGKCEGSECTVTMVGDDSPPGRDTATVFKDQLEQLGFKVNFQPVEHSLMYTKFCSIPSNQPDVCPNVGWIKDCNDPECFFDVPWYGPAINPDNNSNWGRLDDPEVNKAIDDARLITDPEERAQAYGDLDRLVTSKAAVVPWVWDNDVIVRSPDVDLVVNLFNALVDISYTSIRQ